MTYPCVSQMLIFRATFSSVSVVSCSFPQSATGRFSFMSIVSISAPSGFLSIRSNSTYKEGSTVVAQGLSVTFPCPVPSKSFFCQKTVVNGSGARTVASNIVPETCTSKLHPPKSPPVSFCCFALLCSLPSLCIPDSGKKDSRNSFTDMVFSASSCFPLPKGMEKLIIHSLIFAIPENSGPQIWSIHPSSTFRRNKPRSAFTPTLTSPRKS